VQCREVRFCSNTGSLFANNHYNCILGRSKFIIKQHYLSMHGMKEEAVFVMISNAGGMMMRLG